MNRIFKLMFLAMAAVVFCSSAQAANYTNSASGNWSEDGSWTGTKPLAGASDAVIVFNPAGTDDSVNNLSGAFLLNQMWQATDQTVNLSASGGSSLLFTNATTTMPVITNAGLSTFTLNTPITMGTNLTIGVGNASGNITINSNITSIAGSNVLTKTGAGTLTLTGTNAYTGATTVSGGTLTVNGGMITNTASLTMNGSGAALIITNGGTLFGTNMTASPSTFGTYIGTSATTKTNQVLVTGANSKWDVGHSISFSGISNTLTINSGIVTNLPRIYLGYGTAGNSLIITNGGKLYTGSTSYIGDIGGANGNSAYVGDLGSLWNGGGATIQIAYRGIGNSLTVDNCGMVTNVGSLYVGIAAGTDAALNNYMVITNGGQVFSTLASYIGANAGTYVVNSNYVVIAGGNARWDLGNKALTNGQAGSTGNWMTVSSGGILTNCSSVALGGVGSALNIYGGDVYVANVNVTVPDAQLNFNGGTLHATRNGNLISGAVWTNTTAASLDTVGYTVTNAIVVAGTGALTKLGVGTMVLTSNNTYSGATTVSNGVLKLTAAGSISNSAVVNVVSGAVFDVSAYAPYTPTNQILAGNGVVTGSVVVAAGAGVSGGDTSGGGVLSFSNNLTLSPGAVVHSYYNATTNNGINVAGTLSLPTVATVQVTQVSGSLPSSYVLFTFGAGAGAASSNGSLPGWVITGGRSYSQAVVNNGQVKLVSPTGMIVEIY